MENSELLETLILAHVSLSCVVISVLLWLVRRRSAVTSKLFHLHKWRFLAVVTLFSGQIMELIASMLKDPFAITKWSNLIGCLYTILLTVLVRQIETRGFSGQPLYGVIVTDGVFLILKTLKWIWIIADELLSQSLLFYIIGSVVIATGVLIVIDVQTALAELIKHVYSGLFLFGLTSIYGGIYSYIFQKEPRFRYRDKSTHGLNKQPYSHFLSQITFSWISPLIWFGYRQKHLDIGDLGSTPEKDTCRFQYDIFQLNYKSCSKSLWKCYFRSHRKYIFVGGLLKLLSDCLVLVGPVSISYILKYLENVEAQSVSSENATTSTEMQKNETVQVVEWQDFSSSGLFWAFLIFASICVQSVVSQCSTHLINMVGISVRNSLQGIIYRKALKVSIWSTETSTVNKSEPLDVGLFTNLMVDDSFNVMSFFWVIHLIWAIPLKIVFVLVLLYWELGWSAVIGAVTMMMCLVPLQFIIGKYMSENMKKIAGHSDERLKLVNEVLRFIKIIKLNCWESAFARKIESIREKELGFFKMDSFYWTLISILIQIASGLLILTTLIIHFYGGSNESPNVSQIITCLALFNHLTIALFIFPLTVPVILSAIMSTKRLEEFLELPEVKPKNMGIQTIARIISRSDTHSDLIEDSQSLGTNTDGSGDERSDRVDMGDTLKRSKVFVSRDPWAVTIGKLKFDPTGNQLLGFDIKIPKYSITVIIGPSGSGKTTFLSAILGEIQTVSGEVQWDKCATTSFVPQSPWLISATIRDNITFGEQFRSMQYRKIIECCDLQPDLNAVSRGDETEVGDNGTELSGGQQQRIAIARALYAPANVVLMDDPFSALDDQVTNSIFEKAILNLTRKRRRTIIMTTQNMEIAKQADFVIVMDELKVDFAGTSEETRKSEKYGHIFEGSSSDRRRGSFLRPWGSQRSAAEHWTLLRNIRRVRPFNLCDSFEEASSRRSVKRNSLFGSRHLTYEIPLPMDEYNDHDTVKLGESFYSKSGVDSPTQKTHRTMSLCLGKPLGIVTKSPVVRNISSPPSIPGTSQKRFSLRSSIKRLTSRTDSIKSNQTKIEGVILEGNEVNLRNNSEDWLSQETIAMEEGSTGLVLKPSASEAPPESQLSFWLFYLGKCGWALVLVFSISSCIYQSLKIYSDVWLSEVVDEDVPVEMLHPHINSYMILNVLCILVAVLSVPFGQYAGHMARKAIHSDLIKTLLIIPVEQINIGQFIHRFANDVSVIDKKICPTSFRLLQFIILWVSAILINTYIVPWFLVITIPLVLLYFFIQRFFSAPLKALQKLESKTWEPLISNFAESLKGLNTIRAFNQESVFMDRFFNKLEDNNCTYVTINGTNRFLGIVLDVLGGIIVFISILSALGTFDGTNSFADVKIIGLAINYSMMIPIYLNWIVKLLADMEKYMDAVRRIKGEVEPLKRIPETIFFDKCLVPISWPQNGEIIFEGVTLQHRSRNSTNGPVLMDINVTIPRGQKVGICGRTGSGKSSFVTSLFGALDVTKGRILIDDVDIGTIPLEELRTRLAIISQSVALFTGTVRENADPCGIHTDDEIQTALKIAQLKGMDLNMMIQGDGGNLSHGQRQLICLARAILRSPVCFVLDEATSSLDMATEKKLLDAAIDAFQGRTIIAVAHRLHTLSHFDRILVFDKGRLVKDGPAQEIIPSLDANVFQ